MASPKCRTGSDDATSAVTSARNRRNLGTEIGARLPRAHRTLIGCEGEAAVGVEAARIGGGGGIDGGRGGGEQGLRGAPGRGTQLRLDLGEGQFNGIEVRGVGRQEEQPGSDRLKGQAGGLLF